MDSLLHTGYCSFQCTIVKPFTPPTNLPLPLMVRGGATMGLMVLKIQKGSKETFKLHTSKSKLFVLRTARAHACQLSRQRSCKQVCEMNKEKQMTGRNFYHTINSVDYKQSFQG